MKYDSILIYFWACHKSFPGLEFDHEQEMPYKLENLNYIIEKALAVDLKVMLSAMGNQLVVYIDDRHFQQR